MTNQPDLDNLTGQVAAELSHDKTDELRQNSGVHTACCWLQGNRASRKKAKDTKTPPPPTTTTNSTCSLHSLSLP
jgi:hypothetical protein